MSNLLYLSILAPWVLAALLMALPKSLPERLFKILGLIGFGIPAILGAIIFCEYARANTGSFLFLSEIDTGLSTYGISLKLGVNGISAPLVLLAGIVGIAAGITAVTSVAERMRTYLVLLLVMQGGLMGIFVTYDIFYIYFFHEIALIPAFIMIAIWGGPNKRPAAMEMTIYLTLGAMLSLVGLVGIYASSGVGSFDLISLSNYLSENSIQSAMQESLFGLLMFGLGILVSLFPFHSWAPRGYSAAPTSVSMLHAGVLKKFGLYALIQVGLPLLGEGSFAWSTALMWLALGNIIIIGLVTMAQKHLKDMISYGSVMHMGYAFLGIASLNAIGVSGAVFLMVAHGLSIALLFNLSVLIQNRTRTFYMDEMGGLGKDAPILAGFLIAAMMASVGLPGFANFWGEFTIFLGLWEVSPLVLALALLGIIISAIYGLRAVKAIAFGDRTEAYDKIKDEFPVKDINWVERSPGILLLLALLILGLMPRMAGDGINLAVTQHILAGEAYEQIEASLTAQPADILLQDTTQTTETHEH